MGLQLGQLRLLIKSFYVKITVSRRVYLKNKDKNIYIKSFKKILIVFFTILILLGCSQSGSVSDDLIKVYTRDAASGTREAFESIIGLDSITDDSAETSGNGDMATQVGANLNAIGYVSLSSDLEANNLKALKYEGVSASVENVINLSYKLARPFSFVTRAEGDFESDEKEQLVTALLDYIVNSKDGKEFILAAGGIVDLENSPDWETLKVKHPIINQDNSHLTINTGGSTSVDKSLSRVVSSFIPLAGNFNYKPNHTGSGDGYKRTLGSEKDGANKIDIGFASRDFNEDEDISKAMLSGVYTMDAVVVVVHKDNKTVDSLSAKKLVEIFSGDVISWKKLD